MDFASLMTAEISKTKEKSTTTIPEATTATASRTKKYLRRAEIESQREEAYLEEQASLQRARDAKARQKRKIEEEESTRARAREEKRRRLAHESRIRREEEEATKEHARRKRLGLPDLPPPSSSDTNAKDGEAADGNGLPIAAEQEDIPNVELLALLRKLGEPAILFDESHRARLRRYR
ncbi:mRNA splicing protein prp18, partial [Peltigera leucophlebia]|nr:mRNA splicing protein prp18 [Peltigera leucophlebia]